MSHDKWSMQLKIVLTTNFIEIISDFNTIRLCVCVCVCVYKSPIKELSFSEEIEPQIIHLQKKGKKKCKLMKLFKEKRPLFLS